MCSADDKRAGHPGARVGTGLIRIISANEGLGSAGRHTPMEQGQGWCADRGVSTVVGISTLLTPVNLQRTQSINADSANHNVCGRAEHGEGGGSMGMIRGWRVHARLCT